LSGVVQSRKIHFKCESSYEVAFWRDVTNTRSSERYVLIVKRNIVRLEYKRRVSFVHTREVRHLWLPRKVRVLLSKCHELYVSCGHLSSKGKHIVSPWITSQGRSAS